MKVFTFIYYKVIVEYVSTGFIKIGMKSNVKTTKIWSVLTMGYLDFAPVSKLCADGIATRSIAGTIESYLFKTFVCDDVTVVNLCLCDDVTVQRQERISSFHMKH